VLTLFSEIVPVAGTEILGRLPSAFQEAVQFQAAVSTVAKNVETAKALIAYFTGSQVAPLYKTKGLEPIAPPR
jgi:hypothetical protein